MKTEAVSDDHILTAVQHIRAVLESANADVQRQFLRLFIDKITVLSDRQVQGAKSDAEAKKRQADLADGVQVA